MSSTPQAGARSTASTNLRRKTSRAPAHDTNDRRALRTRAVRSRASFPISKRARVRCRWPSSSSAASSRACTRSSKPAPASANRSRISCPRVRSGKKIVLSTGTIALQEQLVRKDIPLVDARRSASPLRVTLLKGRNHYLCKREVRADARRPARCRRRARCRRCGRGPIARTTATERSWRSSRTAAGMGTARRRCRRLHRRVLRDTFAIAGSSRSATRPNTPISSSSTTRSFSSISRWAAGCSPPYDVVDSRRSPSVRALGDRRADRHGLARARSAA